MMGFSNIKIDKFGSVFKLIRVVTYVLRLVGNVKEVLFTNGFIYARNGWC